MWKCYYKWWNVKSYSCSIHVNLDHIPLLITWIVIHRFHGSLRWWNVKLHSCLIHVNFDHDQSLNKKTVIYWFHSSREWWNVKTIPQMVKREITFKLDSRKFWLQPITNYEYCHSLVLWFPRMVKREITFTLDSRKFWQQPINNFDILMSWWVNSW